MMMFPLNWLKKLRKSLVGMWNNLLLFLILCFWKGVKKEMAVVYATLIVKGKKTFAQVPDKLKEAVREILIALEVPELAE